MNLESLAKRLGFVPLASYEAVQRQNARLTATHCLLKRTPANKPVCGSALLKVEGVTLDGIRAWIDYYEKAGEWDPARVVDFLLLPASSATEGTPWVLTGA
jgi:hypothetical protein